MSGESLVSLSSEPEPEPVYLAKGVSEVISPANDPSFNSSPILHCVLAGGLGGAIGDSSMHSLDTVKTRQQGAPHIPKYRNMFAAYRTIFREEGLRKGLYGGYGACMLGSFPGTSIFFGTYETIKRLMIGRWGLNETISHFTAGFLGDLASSFVYVPSEVLKTRLQLQGQYNNKHFISGYNYNGTLNAIKDILAKEGWQTFFYGYKATLVRDLPFSALQLTFYERFRQLAFGVPLFVHPRHTGLEGDLFEDSELSVPAELLTGAAAGGLAGVLTTPLDVVKTRIQTQKPKVRSTNTGSNATPQQPPVHSGKKFIHTGKSNSFHAPSTGGVSPVHISTSSVTKGLALIYKTEGIRGLFSGVFPRFVWTSVQSSIMLLLYQLSLSKLDSWFPEDSEF